MNAAAGPLTTALFTLLNGDTGAGGLRNVASPLVVGVFDFGAVERDQEYPYLTIGEFTSGFWGTFAKSGEQLLATTHIWTQGRGFKSAHAILTRVNQLIGDAALTVAGYATARSLFDRSFNVSDPDDRVQHVVAAYRVWLQEV